MQFFNYTSLPAALTEIVAGIHERIPLSWDPFRTVSAEKVLLTKIKLSSKNTAQVVIVALDARQALIGFHWITLRDEKALVLSTWVVESKRHLGIGKNLKRQGEAWAIKQNSKAIISKVHFSNLDMKALNIGCGYSLVGEENKFQIFQKNYFVVAGL